MPLTTVREFLKLEAAGGIVLIIVAVFALFVANSPLWPLYDAFLDMPVVMQVGALIIAKPMILWINDGLMAVFFFLIGLEVKREFLRGELSTPSQLVLPAVAAVGGMAVPGAIYVFINWGTPENLNGWAIPAATDIAFALGIMALLGSRAPLSLKVLLTAIAVMDDLGAIIIIALFYTEDLSVLSLIFAGVGIVVLAVMNRAGINRIAPYILVGVYLWICVLQSGVHATLAGVITGLFIPFNSGAEKDESMLEHLEHMLHPWIAFGILPVFAFANAGVDMTGVGVEAFVEPVKLGVSMGLFVGKQIGIFALLFLVIRLGWSPMPEGANWRQLYGVSMLCGIGFTMSLFIGSLAFEHADFDAPIKLGVITGSLLSGVGGYLLLRFSGNPVADPDSS